MSEHLCAATPATTSIVCHEAGGENQDRREALICLRRSVMTGCPCDTGPRESLDEFLLGLMNFVLRDEIRFFVMNLRCP